MRAETINAGTAASAGESFSGGEGCLPFHNEQGSVSSPYASRHTPLTSEHNAVVPPYLPSSGAPLITPPINTASPYYSVASIPISQLLQPESPNYWPIASPEATVTAPLTYKEACLVHHFATQLGRWLDCTDASRQFTRKIPALVKTSPILLHAVISYAARHVGDADVAEQAHERCVELLIPSLSSETVADDDVLLCAIVILRVFEQLNGKSRDRPRTRSSLTTGAVMVTGSDQERHLAGCSALLRASQGRQVDPSTPGLRQAAFWVYMRQCLYNACVYQQPPNVDPNLVLLPPPSGGDPISDLKSETAWANTMTWICATVVHFCFGSNYPEPLARMHKWRELYDAVESWRKNRPDTFDPIWYSDPVPGNSNPFPEIWFTADWHGMCTPR